MSNHAMSNFIIYVFASWTNSAICHAMLQCSFETFESNNIYLGLKRLRLLTHFLIRGSTTSKYNLLPCLDSTHLEVQVGGCG